MLTITSYSLTFSIVYSSLIFTIHGNKTFINFNERNAPKKFSYNIISLRYSNIYSNSIDDNITKDYFLDDQATVAPPIIASEKSITSLSRINFNQRLVSL